MQTHPTEFVEAKISEIDISDNRSLVEENVLQLMKSITKLGQIVNIIVKKNGSTWRLVAGGHRVEAMKRLGFETIKANVFEGTDEKLVQLHENTIRANLRFVHKIEAAKWIQENMANPVGKRISQNRGKLEDAMEESGVSHGFGKPPAHTEDLVVEHGIFNNKETYRQAIKVYKECIPEVFPLIDAGAVSIYYAFNNIIPVPKKKQKSLLHDIGVDASVDRSLVRNKIKDRLKKQRKEDAGIPENPDIDPIYNVLRVSPDWEKDTMPFLFDLPIRDYISDVGVLFLECPNTRLSDAFELCRKWGLTYKASVTVYNAKQPLKTRAFQSQVTPEFIDTTSYHILIAQADPAICGATITNIMAVYNKQHPDTAMADIINQMCTCDRDMKLDLTSDTPRTGWKIWKIDYANNTDKQ